MNMSASPLMYLLTSTIQKVKLVMEYVPKQIFQNWAV